MIIKCNKINLWHYHFKTADFHSTKNPNVRITKKIKKKGNENKPIKLKVKLQGKKKTNSASNTINNKATIK